MTAGDGVEHDAEITSKSPWGRKPTDSFRADEAESCRSADHPSPPSINNVYFFNWTFMALGLSLIWGYGGALSFGQTAFFGVADYSYSVISINLGDAYGLTLFALLAAILISALFAAVLGYFLFFGRISGVFLGIVTLSVTLVLECFMSQTAGPEWRIGAARLNGFNGMGGMPSLTIPWPGGDIALFPDIPLYYVTLALLTLAYLGLRILVNSRFGSVLVAIRENPLRAEMLGYDIRRHQLAAFVIGSALAGLSVMENLSVGECISGAPAPKERLEQIFSFFPILAERRGQAAGTMSGGQQQQLAIGRVLIGSPSLILLDKPAEGIQPNIVQDIARIMVELNRATGVTIVFVEQNIDMIPAMAQRAYVMDKGPITDEITPDALEDRDAVRRYLAV